mgnify:CR=1 FL=1
MKISKISMLHYIKLVFRSILLISALTVYLVFKFSKKDLSISDLELTFVFEKYFISFLKDRISSVFVFI